MLIRLVVWVVVMSDANDMTKVTVDNRRFDAAHTARFNDDAAAIVRRFIRRPTHVQRRSHPFVAIGIVDFRYCRMLPSHRVTVAISLQLGIAWWFLANGRALNADFRSVDRLAFTR